MGVEKRKWRPWEAAGNTPGLIKNEVELYRAPGRTCKVVEKSGKCQHKPIQLSTTELRIHETIDFLSCWSRSPSLFLSPSLSISSLNQYKDY